MASRVKGGKKYRDFAEGFGKGGVKGIRVGFFSSDRYQDGNPVADVAAKHEFGVDVPERPFFRQTVSRVRGPVLTRLKRYIDPKKMILTNQDAGLIGAFVTGQIQKQIVKLKDPPNSPRTIAQKKSANPLIDTSVMLRAVTWEVEN